MKHIKGLFGIIMRCCNLKVITTKYLVNIYTVGFLSQIEFINSYFMKNL